MTTINAQYRRSIAVMALGLDLTVSAGAFLEALRLVAVLAAVAILTSPATAAAQTSGGAIVGVIADAQGGVLPGVAVTARNEDSGAVRATVTEADGRYSAAGPSP